MQGPRNSSSLLSSTKIGKIHMNIVIIGGGQKFGKIIADKFRANGENVFVLSHKNYGESINHLSANFLSVKNVEKIFHKLIENISHIDILLYCSNGDYGPSGYDSFNTFANIDEISINWQKTITVQAVVPHIISIIALQKMSKNSKIVFMTSGIAFSVPRIYAQSSVGHPGGKASQNHLMFALANHNDKNAMVYSISTHFDIDNIEMYNKRIDQIFSNLQSFDPSYSGRIVEIFN